MGRKRPLGTVVCTMMFPLIIGFLFFTVIMETSGIGDMSGALGSHAASNFYRAPLLNNPRTLDPGRVQDLYGSLIVHQLCDRLVQFSRDLFVIPAIAESWTVEDQGKTYRFSLRKNAFFHDGRPVTSTDVVYSVSRLFRLSPSPTILPHLLKIRGATEYSKGESVQIAGLQALDPHTVVIQLEQAYAPFLIALGMYHTSILPAGSAESEEVFNRNPIGCGPFRMVSWQENREILLERYVNHYAGPSRLDGVHFRIYPGIGMEEVWQDFQAGKLDEMPVYPQIRQQLEGRSDLNYVHRPSLSILFYGFNTAQDRLKNVKFRSLLSRSIDRSRLTREVYGGQFEPSSGILPPGLPGYQPIQPQSTQKESKPATSEVSDDVIPDRNSEPIEIVSNSQSPLAQSELNFVQEEWEKIGVKVVPKYIPDWTEFEKYLKSDDVQIYRYAWFADIPDPDDFLRVLFSSYSAVNYMRYKNPEVDEKLQTAVGILDPIQRAQKYQEIQTILSREAPAIPLLYLSIDMVYQSHVRDVELTALGSHTTSYQRVWLDRKVAP